MQNTLQNQQSRLDLIEKQKEELNSALKQQEEQKEQQQNTIENYRQKSVVKNEAIKIAQQNVQENRLLLENYQKDLVSQDGELSELRNKLRQQEDINFQMKETQLNRDLLFQN